jgi:hypothetical protein
MREAFRATPLPVLLVIASFICPTEFSVVISDLRLSPHRLVFLFLVPLALWRLTTRTDTRLAMYDAPFFALALWQILIFTYHAGEAGLAFGGSWAVESLGGYLVARAWIRDHNTLIATLRVIVVSIAIAAVVALLDTLTASYFTHELLRSVLGGEPMPPVEFRQGLARAASTFDHPIHFGTYCAAMLALVYMAEPVSSRRNAFVALMIFAAALSLSSAPILSLLLQIGMLVWDRATRGFHLRTHIAVAILAGLYVGVLFVSHRPPLQLLITLATFDPWTGLYRMLIWEHGLTNVWASPWLGLGLADWERPQWMVSSTIDAFWLVLTMRSGIPAFLLLALGIILMARRVLKRGVRARDPERRRMAMGWMISLIAFCLLGATVHFWNVPHALFYFFIGMGGALANPRVVQQAVPTHAIAQLQTRRRHPSFNPGYGANPHPA